MEIGWKRTGKRFLSWVLALICVLQLGITGADGTGLLLQQARADVTGSCVLTAVSQSGGSDARWWYTASGSSKVLDHVRMMSGDPNEHYITVKVHWETAQEQDDLYTDGDGLTISGNGVSRTQKSSGSDTYYVYETTVTVATKSIGSLDTTVTLGSWYDTAARASFQLYTYATLNLSVTPKNADYENDAVTLKDNGAFSTVTYSCTAQSSDGGRDNEVHVVWSLTSSGVVSSNDYASLVNNTAAKTAAVTAKKEGTVTVYALAWYDKLDGAFPSDDDGNASTGAKRYRVVSSRNLTFYTKETSMTMTDTLNGDQDITNRTKTLVTADTKTKATTLKSTLTLKGAQVLGSYIAWEVSDSSIVKLNTSSAGCNSYASVKPLKAGKVTITAYYKNDKTKKVSCTIQVVQNTYKFALKKTSIAMVPGDSYTLVPVVNGVEKTVDQVSVTWTSSDESLVSVYKGTVKSMDYDGASLSKDATITAYYNGDGTLSATCKVSVVYPKNLTSSVSSKKVTYSSKTTTAYSVTVVGQDDKSISNCVSVKWSSGNTSVATIDSDGKLTTVRPGSTTITATCGTQSVSIPTTVTMPVSSTDITASGVADIAFRAGAKFTQQTPVLKLGSYTLTKGTLKEVASTNTAAVYKDKSGKYYAFSGSGDYAVAEDQTGSAGNHTMTIVGDGTYFTGTRNIAYKITQRALSSNGIKVSAIGTQVYTGQNITPKVTVKDGTTTLSANTDYKVTYTNNRDKGKATVTITGTGNYTGTLTRTFKIKKLTQPVLKSLSDAAGGMKVTWKKVTDAGLYGIYRSTDGKAYSLIGTSATTSFVDTTGTFGQKYYYTVACVSSEGNAQQSTYDKVGLHRVYKSGLTSADLTLVNRTGGISVNWTSKSGADGYIIYRKTGKGNYKKVKTLANETGWLDTSVAKDQGVTYTYLIRPTMGSAIGGGSGLKVIRVCTPEKFAAVKTSAGYRVTWKAQKAVTGYMIQYSADDEFRGAKTCMVTGASSASAVLKGLTSGKKWHIRIRSYRKIGSKVYYSAFTSIVSGT